MIDKLNPNLRFTDECDGKIRKHEFYNVSRSDAYTMVLLTQGKKFRLTLDIRVEAILCLMH